MEEIIQDTGIFRRITRRMKTPDDVKAIVEEWHDDHDVEKRLGDVAITLQEIVAAYRDTNAKTFQVIKGKRYKFGHRYGDLANDAPPEAFDARDALKLMDDIRALIAQKMIDRAVIAAYELGFTCCQIGVRRHEATVKGRARGPAKRRESAEQTKRLIREEFVKIRDEGMLGTQEEIVDRLLDRPTLPDGSKMPRRRIIEEATKGLTPHKKSPRKR